LYTFVLQFSGFYFSAGSCCCTLPCSVATTEVNLARRPTSYIPTPANANFALGSDLVHGQLKVLYHVTRWLRSRNPIGRNAMKTREHMEYWWNFMMPKHFQILCTLLGIVWNHLITPISWRHGTTEIDQTIFCQKSLTRHFK